MIVTKEVSRRYCNIVSVFVGLTSEERIRNVSELQSLYLKIFFALQDSSFLSKKTFCIQQYNVESPMIGDILSMVDPLMV